MLSSITVLALALAAQAAPAPSPALVGGESKFSVPAIHNEDFTRNGTAALLKAYKKWNLTPTRDVPVAFKAALGKRQDSSAPVSYSPNRLLVFIVGKN